jgi:hypothetical protein
MPIGITPGILMELQIQMQFKKAHKAKQWYGYVLNFRMVPRRKGAGKE